MWKSNCKDLLVNVNQQQPNVKIQEHEFHRINLDDDHENEMVAVVVVFWSAENWNFCHKK